MAKVYGEGGVNETNTAHQIGVLYCPRCKEFHYNLIFYPMDEVVGPFTHSAVCPAKQELILMFYDGKNAQIK